MARDRAKLALPAALVVFFVISQVCVPINKPHPLLSTFQLCLEKSLAFAAEHVLEASAHCGEMVWLGFLWK